MYPKSFRTVDIASMEVVANIIPLSLYKAVCDKAEIVITVKLSQPMHENTRLMFPYCDSIRNPEVFTMDGNQILSTFNSTDSEEEKRLLELIKKSSQELHRETEEQKINELNEMINEYKELKNCVYVVNIPKGQQYLKISFEKEIQLKNNILNYFDIGDNLSYFILKDCAESPVNIMVLMPAKPLDILKSSNGISGKVEEHIIAGRTVLSQLWKHEPCINILYRYHEHNRANDIYTGSGI